WDGTTWTRVTDVGPEARRGFGAFDSARERRVIFGGRADSGVLGDTWELVLGDGGVPDAAAAFDAGAADSGSPDAGPDASLGGDFSSGTDAGPGGPPL